jgi:hypothetical protein
MKMRAWLAIGASLIACQADEARSRAPTQPSPRDATDAAPDAVPPISIADAAPGVPDAASGVPDTASVPDAACAPSTTQLLDDPGFERGPNGGAWLSDTDPRYVIIKDPSQPIQPEPDGGVFVAAFGGNTARGASLWQPVTVPAGTTMLELTGWYRIKGSAGNTDTATISLVTDGSSTTLISFDSSADVAAWTPFRVSVPVPPGNAVTFLMQASRTLNLYETSFSFDALTLNARSCP